MTGKKHTEEAKKRIAAAREKYIGEKCPSWKGGRRVNHNGYIQVRVNNHPRSVNGYVFEHILIGVVCLIFMVVSWVSLEEACFRRRLVK